MFKNNNNPFITNALSLDLLRFLIDEGGVLLRTSAKTDHRGSGWLTRNEIAQPGAGLSIILWGRVVDSCGGINGYRVQAEHGGVYNCTLGSLTAFNPYGARSSNSLPVGAGVYFIAHRQSLTGVIITVEPDPMTDPRNLRSDYISQGSNSGFYSDIAHSSLINSLIQQGGFPCWLSGRPMDSTSAGEWGVSSETGLAAFLDSFMAYLRVDEETGLFLYYHDQLARLTGHNLQVRSALSDSEELDDQSELIGFSGSTPYPWELVGSPIPVINPQQIYSEQDAVTMQTSGQMYSLLEPYVNDQQSFYRTLEFKGYLGQGFKKIVCIPNPLYSAPRRYSNNIPDTIGVFNEQAALDGSYALESAKRVFIAKRSSIAVPKMVIRPEDPNGDVPSTYKFAGYFPSGTGQNHVIADSINVTTPDAPPELIRAATVLDLSAFTFNWQGLHPFFYHTKDWYLPEESDCYLSENQITPTYSTLIYNQYLQAPTPFSVQVDHREIARYYPNESFMVMLEDGGVVIGDGFGGEIRMTGGTVRISAPGDIMVESGRSIINFAGFDNIVKANNCVDISTSHADVRIKAEKECWILSGNGGCGGTIIENRATCASYDFPSVGTANTSSGIYINSLYAPTVARGSDILLQTYGNPIVQGSGNIIIDSYSLTLQTIGTPADIISDCSNRHSFMAHGKFDYFWSGTTISPGSDQPAWTVNEYWYNSTLLATPLKVLGDTTVTGNVEANGWFVAIGGYFGSDQATQHNCTVAQIVNPDNTPFTDIFNRESLLTTQLANQVYDNVLLQEINTGLSKAYFTFRNESQYLTDTWVLVENRWQQLARLGSEVPNYWTETYVNTLPAISLSQMTHTAPYPGYDMTFTETGYVTQDLRLYNVTGGGQDVNRQTNQAYYEAPIIGPSNKHILSGNYPVILS